MKIFFVLFLALFQWGCTSNSLLVSSERPNQLAWNYSFIDKMYFSQNELNEKILDSKNILASNILDLTKTIKQAELKKIEPKALAIINQEGILDNDPKYLESTVALNQINLILRWSICARFKPDTQYQNMCYLKAKKAIYEWVKTYQPTGNSINEHRLLKIFLAIDILNLTQDAEIKSWLNKFIIEGDNYFQKDNNSKKNFNNWKTWHLAIRGTIAILLNNPQLITQTQSQIQSHVQVNLIPPPNWAKLNTCENNKNELNYGSYDFRHRDALHYHVFNLEAWAWIVNFTPQFLNGDHLKRIEDAINFLQPYFKLEKEHIEFVCSKVAFDIERRKAHRPIYENKPWDNHQANNLLLFIRDKFTSVQSWTNSLDESKFDPSYKFILNIQKTTLK